MSHELDSSSAASSSHAGSRLTSLFRTDNAVLATNGFAADGNNFVKRVKQRLEVSTGKIPQQIAAFSLTWY